MAQKFDYPVHKDVKVRPFHLYDEEKQKVLPHKFFSIARNAHDKAMVEARWFLPVGQTLTVLDIRHGIVLGQYTRRLHAVAYMGPENLLAVEKQQKGRGKS